MRKRYFSVRIARRDSAHQDFSPELITESKHFVQKKGAPAGHSLSLSHDRALFRAGSSCIVCASEPTVVLRETARNRIITLETCLFVRG